MFRIFFKPQLIFVSLCNMPWGIPQAKEPDEPYETPRNARNLKEPQKNWVWAWFWETQKESWKLRSYERETNIRTFRAESSQQNIPKVNKTERLSPGKLHLYKSNNMNVTFVKLSLNNI